MSPRIDECRRQLLTIYREAITRLSGQRLVSRSLLGGSFPEPFHVLSVGKASLSMMRGALADPQRVLGGLVVHPRQQEQLPFPDTIEVQAAEHPLPGEGSFAAGYRVLDFLDELPPSEPLLVLLSGGGSSLMEAPREGVSEDDLLSIHAWLLSSGLDIVEVNRVRQSLSAVKGGALARRLRDRPCRVLTLSDVPPDHPSALASGPFLPPITGPLPGLPDWISVLVGNDIPSETPDIDHVSLADSGRLASTAAELGQDIGLPVSVDDGWLEGDAADVGRRIADTVLASAPGLFVWTGETTMTLPIAPGRGGRCQQLALAAAERFAGHGDCLLLACGSDGLDGPEGDAGAIVDGGTVARGEAAGLGSEDALDWADAGRFLEASGDLVNTGPTDTNVNDLILALRLPS